MASGATIGLELPVAEDTSATWASEAAMVALMLLPGALIVFTGFNAGGYFPGTPAVVAIVLSQVLLVRILQARRPFEGIAPRHALGDRGLGPVCGPHLGLGPVVARDREGAVIEFDRAWSYLLVLVLFATVRASPSQPPLAAAGLGGGHRDRVRGGARDEADARRVAHRTGRVQPAVELPGHLLEHARTACRDGDRALLSPDLAPRENARRGVLAAGVMPLLATTLFFTFSRGSIWAGAIGLAVYVWVARPRGC